MPALGFHTISARQEPAVVESAVWVLLGVAFLAAILSRALCVGQ
ncbi:hypothetical protein [Spongiactinospora rosea]|nr:hypothetical protein [Spongiactinospora rosea]